MSEPNDDLPADRPKDIRSFFAGMDHVQLVAVGALVVAVVAGLIVAFTAFGGQHSKNVDASGGLPVTNGHGHVTPASEIPASTDSGDTAADGSNTPTDEASSANSASSLPSLTPAIGHTLMDNDHATAICTALPGGSDVNSLDLLPGGKAVIGCDTTDRAGDSQVTLVAYDLMAGRVLWTYEVPSGADYTIGSQHILEVDSTDHPAIGLKAEYTTYTLTAVELTTGQKSWTIPYETWLSSDDTQNTNGLAVSEGPHGGSSASNEIVVSYFDTSGFDAATGKLLWKGPKGDGSSFSYELHSVSNGDQYPSSDVTYVAAGVAVDLTADGLVTGESATTGTQLWEVDFPDWLYGAVTQAAVSGTVEVNGGDAGYIRYDVTTGHVLGSGQFPSNFGNSLLTSDYAVGNTGTQLVLYSLANPKTPVWSVAADQSVTPLAGGSGHVLVSAPTGEEILSTSNGSTTATVPDADDFENANGLDLVDGLVAGDNNDILELDPPTEH
jgi:hypothetical protein